MKNFNLHPNSVASSYEVKAGFVIFAMALMMITAGCRTTESDEPKSERKEIELGQTTFSFDIEGSSFDYFRQYRILPGDVLDVLYQMRTWQQEEEFRLAIDHVITVKFINLPELNETERVRPDGKITLPYLGEINVVGMTVSELTKELENRYSTILQSPQIHVLVPEFRSAIQELKQDLHTAPRGLSRLTTVRPDGFATFAMVGDIMVAGRTIDEVSRELNEKYSKILPGLSTDLFLERSAGGRVYVLGEVTRPDSYQISRPTSVVEALSMAGSWLPTANLRSIVIVRRHENKMVGTKINLRRTLKLKEDSQFFYLKPDDIVYVPRRQLSRWADIAREVQAVIFFRGWGASIGASYDLNDDNND
jgi:polysaccharide export outer membrane protein